MIAAPAAQNNNKWADPYQKGLKAFNAKNYRIAINFFEQAVAAEPRSGANKRVEGVFYTDYFPYYYLGVAHLELRQYEKAQENFDKARNGLTRPLVIKLDEYERRLTAELQIARGVGGRSDQPPQNAAFEQAVRTADAALAAKRFGEAAAAFDAARAADAAEYARRSVQLRRDEAARGVAGEQLANEGQQLLERSQLNAARTKFQQADQALAGQSVVTDGLAEIRRRQDLYQQLTSGAEQDVRGNRLQSALDKYTQARAADPGQFAADNIDARVTSVSDRLKAAANTSRPVPAPAAAPPAPSALDTSKQPDSNERRLAGQDAATLRSALVVLLQGDAQQSISILEPALAGRRGGGDSSSAALHAYLGVAYATQALSSVKQDEPARLLREKALAEFRLAVSAQRDYRLSPRVVSPRIVELFEQVRSN